MVKTLIAYLLSSKKKLSTFLLIALTIVLAMLVTQSMISTANQKKLLSDSSNQLIIEPWHIQLYSTKPIHQDLVESSFLIEATAHSGGSFLYSKGDELLHSKLELIEPRITLQMLDMNCGIVNASIITNTPSLTMNDILTLDEDGHRSTILLTANAAPLMKGTWVATASFRLNEPTENIYKLHYEFEVK